MKFTDNRYSRQPTRIWFSTRPSTALENQILFPPFKTVLSDFYWILQITVSACNPPRGELVTRPQTSPPVPSKPFYLCSKWSSLITVSAGNPPRGSACDASQTSPPVPFLIVLLFVVSSFIETDNESLSGLSCVHKQSAWLSCPLPA